MTYKNVSQETFEAAKDRLQTSSSVVIRGVSCDRKCGALVLRGRVPSDYCRQLAEILVADVPGIPRLANQIEVVR